MDLSSGCISLDTLAVRADMSACALPATNVPAAYAEIISNALFVCCPQNHIVSFGLPLRETPHLELPLFDRTVSY
jgi:hypothetical protein